MRNPLRQRDALQTGGWTRRGFTRHGFTLVELLVVITIIFMLTAAAIPLVRPALEGRESRDTARAVSMFISGARTRAMELGRPVGVMIQRDPAQPHIGVRMSLAMVPEPYTGDTPQSMARIEFLTSTSEYVINQFLQNDVGWGNQVRIGDLIQFNMQGPWWIIGEKQALRAMDNTAHDNGSDADSERIYRRDDPTGRILPSHWPGSTTTSSAVRHWALIPTTPNAVLPVAAGPVALPFKIYRQPVGSNERVLVLPPRTMVDLMSSGIGAYPQSADAFFYPIDTRTTPPADYGKIMDLSGVMGAGAADKPVIIMFAPNGSLTGVYRHYLDSTPTWQWGQTTPTDMIYLAIGPRVQVPTFAEMRASNTWPILFRESDGVLTWEDLGNIWITINPVTGMVQTAENAAVTWAGTPPTDAWPMVRDGVTQARAFAREAQAMGGR
jgi:prepilin-type N-terminal cleavage/methylation domain-containing protein